MNKKTVLITGSTGLAASLAEKFSMNNYNVIITYIFHEKEALELKSSLEKKYGNKVLCIECDLSSEENINYLFKAVYKIFDKVDVLVNNASFSYDTTFEDKTKEMFMKILEVNLVGTFLVSRLFGDKMFKDKNGTIINISSTNGIDTYYEYSLDYDASKAGVINLTHNLANHYHPYVRVNCVAPGWIDTPMNKDMDNEFKEKEEKKILLGRFAKPEEVANLVYFLASEDASYINDSVIRIDGGVNND